MFSGLPPQRRILVLGSTGRSNQDKSLMTDRELSRLSDDLMERLKKLADGKLNSVTLLARGGAGLDHLPIYTFEKHGRKLGTLNVYLPYSRTYANNPTDDDRVFESLIAKDHKNAARTIGYPIKGEIDDLVHSKGRWPDRTTMSYGKKAGIKLRDERIATGSIHGIIIYTGSAPGEGYREDVALTLKAIRQHRSAKGKDMPVVDVVNLSDECAITEDCDITAKIGQ